MIASRLRHALAILSLSVAATGFPRAPLSADGTARNVAAEPGGEIRPPGLRTALAPQPGQGYAGEAEPNGTPATASPLLGSDLVVRASIFPSGDIDYYSFIAGAGDRVHAATLTSFSANGSTNSQLRLFQPDGATLVELDDNDGSLGAQSSSLAGVLIPSPGTYFLQVRHAGAANQLRPYELYFRLQNGAPAPEVEGNDTPATATPLPGSGWVAGARNPAAAAEQDWYSLSLNAGDTVYLSLDLDPERDNVQWNGRLGIGRFGDAGDQVVVVDDASTGSVANPLSEALFLTVKAAGTYYAVVDSASAAAGGPAATYNLSVSVHPSTDEGVNCTTYTSTDVPKTIGPGAGLVSSTISVPGNPRIADLDVSVVLDHARMADIDAHLRSPAGNDNGLFSDIGAATTGGQTQMDVTFDDEAGQPASRRTTALKGIQVKPELAYRLSWFDGENAGGAWTLDLRDDASNSSGGTLTSWSLRVCEPPPPPACAAGFLPTTVFTTDFEAGAAGFTHSGAQDEWALGLPTTAAAGSVAAFTTCHSGASCWKTDLASTYNASSSQDLFSPNIDLTGLSAPVVVHWAQRYQLESASSDRMFVELRQAGGLAAVRLFEWQDATMSDNVGNPAVSIGASAGWSQYSRRADSLAGLNTELRFHLDSNASVELGGLAVDDVTVTACRPVGADLSITKTDGQTSVVPGSSVTYSIAASNQGPDPAPAATVADTFPAELAGVTWTCTGAGGGTCAASGSGSINDTVNLPVGAAVTYTATGTLLASAAGTLTNTATVVPPAGVTDPVPGNNSASDVDSVAPLADLAITKDDGRIGAAPGAVVTYTIVASNAGPNPVVGANVSDVVPGSLTGVSWACVASAGSSCGASGTGDINDPIDLLVGGTATYTLTGTVVANPVSLVNTATVVVPAGMADPNLTNNSATDTDPILCAAELVIVPDGRLTAHTLGASAAQSFRFVLKLGNAYSLEFRHTTGDSTFPNTLAVFSGDDGCLGTSTLTVRDTSGIDPASGPVARVSFTASGADPTFRALLVNGSPSSIPYSFSLSDTTLYSASWSTNGSFNSFYSFQNTTSATVTGTLTFLSTSGAPVGSPATITVPAGQTTSQNSIGLALPRDQTGTVRFTHDGPPGSILAEAAIANFALNPAYVQPVRFVPLREAR